MNNSTNTYFVTTLCLENRDDPCRLGYEVSFCPKSQGCHVYLVKNCKDDRDAMAAVTLWLMRTGRTTLNWVEIPQSASQDMPSNDDLHFEVKVIDNSCHPVDVHHQISELVNSSTG